MITTLRSGATALLLGTSLAACGALSGRGAPAPAPIVATASGSHTPAAGAAAAPVAVGPTDEGLTVTGSVAGAPLAPQSALASPAADPAGSPALLVMLSDQPSACGLLSAATAHQGSSYLLIAIGAGGQTPAPGTYTVGDAAHEAAVQRHRLDASCQEARAASAGTATAGTVQIDSIGADGTVTGRFHVTVGSAGDALSGTFQAAGCAPLAAFIDPTSPAALPTSCR